MACPWFEPTSFASPERAPKPARAPLGKLYNGLCRATTTPAGVDEADLTRLDRCNFGYGRGACPQFPAASEADAVRFSEYDGQLIWILESNHAPLRHGIIGDAGTTPVLARQAEAYRTACLNP